MQLDDRYLIFSFLVAHQAHEINGILTLFCPIYLIFELLIILFIDLLLALYCPVNRSRSSQGFLQVQILHTS